MERFVKAFVVSYTVLLAVVSSICAQEFTNSGLNAEAKRGSVSPRVDWRFTTEAYQTEASKLLLKEVNQIARELNLPEKFPITKSNLVATFIPPPALGMLGTMETSNYAYYVTLQRKFAGIDQQDLEKSWEKVRKAYLWPISRMDTNAAFQMATQIMTAASMDIGGLNRDCTIEIVAPMLPENIYGKKFIPDYWVNWRKPGELVAYIEFVQPDRSIRQLHVYDPKYILSKPVAFPNLGDLLRQGNAPKALLQKMGLEAESAPPKR